MHHLFPWPPYDPKVIVVVRCGRQCRRRPRACTVHVTRTAFGPRVPVHQVVREAGIVPEDPQHPVGQALSPAPPGPSRRLCRQSRRR